jgi:thioesterase domain-containing protein
MAQQLRAQGEDLALLVLLDTPAGNGDRQTAAGSETIHLINFAQELALSLGNGASLDDPGLDWPDLSSLEPDEQLDRILTRAREVGVISANLQMAEGRQLFRVFKANSEAMRRYLPRRYPGRMTLIRANPPLKAKHQDPTLGWGELVAEELELHLVGGSHYMMVRDPFVQELAQVLGVCLERGISQISDRSD